MVRAMRRGNRVAPPGRNAGRTATVERPPPNVGRLGAVERGAGRDCLVRVRVWVGVGARVRLTVRARVSVRD